MSLKKKILPQERVLNEGEIRALVESNLRNFRGVIRIVSGEIKDGSSSQGWKFGANSVAELANLLLESIAEGSEPSILGWQQTMTFSATDHNTVSWTSGIISLSEGTTYSIDSGNTGDMSAINYVYLSVDDSETALQVSTTSGDAVGHGKILIAVAQNNADTASDATFQVFGGRGGALWTTANLAANTVTANEIVANTITGNEITGTTLSGIFANIGTVTSGIIKGVLVQSTDGVNRIQLTSGDRLQFFLGGVEKGNMFASATGDITVEGVDDVLIRAGSADRVQFGSEAVVPLDATYDIGRSANPFVDVFAGTYYSAGDAGETVNQGFVTRINQQKNGGSEVVNIQLKKRTISFKGGIMTTMGTESAWVNAE